MEEQQQNKDFTETEMLVARVSEQDDLIAHLQQRCSLLHVNLMRTQKEAAEAAAAAKAQIEELTKTDKKKESKS